MSPLTGAVSLSVSAQPLVLLLVSPAHFSCSETTPATTTEDTRRQRYKPFGTAINTTEGQIRWQLVGDPLQFFSRALLRVLLFCAFFSAPLARLLFSAFRKKFATVRATPGHTPLPTPGHRRNHMTPLPKNWEGGSCHAWVKSIDKVNGGKHGGSGMSNARFWGGQEWQCQIRCRRQNDGKGSGAMSRSDQMPDAMGLQMQCQGHVSTRLNSSPPLGLGWQIFAAKQ